jgi:hypothetical protein
MPAAAAGPAFPPEAPGRIGGWLIAATIAGKALEF